MDITRATVCQNGQFLRRFAVAYRKDRPRTGENAVLRVCMRISSKTCVGAVMGGITYHTRFSRPYQRLNVVINK